MKAVIVDDIWGHIKIIASILSRECPDVEIVGEALTLVEAEYLILKEQPDLVFLDIRMDRDGLDSFTLLEKLSTSNIGFEVIFITSYGITNELTQAIQLAELDLITKPIEAKLIKEAVERIKNRRNGFKYEEMIRLFLKLLRETQVEKIAINLGDDKIMVVAVNDILYFEADGNKTKIFLKEGSIPLNAKKHLGFYANLLIGEDFKFQRVNRKILVNSVHMKTMERKNSSLTLSTNTQINVSRQFWKEVASNFDHKKPPEKILQKLLNHFKKIIGF
jgi:two-component system, LytTR family, response regulator